MKNERKKNGYKISKRSGGGYNVSKSGRTARLSKGTNPRGTAFRDAKQAISQGSSAWSTVGDVVPSAPKKLKKRKATIKRGGKKIKKIGMRRKY